MNIFKKLFGKKEYKKLLFEYKLRRFDVWETCDSEGYDLYLEVYEIKLKQDKKAYYQIKLPDYTINDYDLLKAFWGAVRYLDNEGPGYSRLLDEYRRVQNNQRKSVIVTGNGKGLLEWETSQKSTPDERTL